MIRLLTRFVARDEATATSFARLLSRLEVSLPITFVVLVAAVLHASWNALLRAARTSCSR
jgi:hypothetical protein